MAGSVPTNDPFMLQKVTITGNQSFSTETLHALVADAECTAQDINQLGQLASRITEFYQDEGYTIVRAILPEQNISQGNVTIRVIEPTYGKVVINNDSKVNDNLIAGAVAPMLPGTIISDSNMYTSLLHLSDIPGIKVNSRLRPGTAVGSSDVVIDTKDGEAYAGKITLDQYVLSTLV